MDIVPDDSSSTSARHGKFNGVTDALRRREKEYWCCTNRRRLLYFPTDQSTGSPDTSRGDRTPVLSRLGNQEWVRTPREG